MTYTVVTDEAPSTPLGIFNRIRQTHEELAPLNDLLEDHELRIAFLLKEGELRFRGQLAAGLAALPDAQGAMKPLFAWLLEETLGYPPDWLIIISADWWDEAKAIDREALVCHEALHCGQLRDKHGEPRFNAMGGPVVGILPHDVEEFHAVARRYGAWTPDLQEFQLALDEGDRAADTTRRLGRDGSLSLSPLRVVAGSKI